MSFDQDDSSGERTPDASGQSSLELLKRIARGSEDAWSEFVHSHSGLIFSRCRRYGLNPDDAVELTQEVLLKVYQKIDRFSATEGPDGLRRWLRRITSHAAVDFYRQRKNRLTEIHPAQIDGLSSSFRKLDLSQEHQNTPADTISEMFPRDRSEQTRLVANALRDRRERIKEKNWQAFWQAAILGLSVADVAAELQMSDQAVRQAKFESLRKLRVELDGVLEAKQ